jgi:hypothetical protein
MSVAWDGEEYRGTVCGHVPGRVTEWVVPGSSVATIHEERTNTFCELRVNESHGWS